MICGLSPVRIQHAALYTGLWLKKKKNPKGLHGGCHGLKVNCTLIEGEMKAGAPLKMSIRHARQ